MALEAELRSRVDKSLRELEEVVGSLNHVKRLADSEHASAQQLSRVAETMEAAAAQFRALLEAVGQSGAMLQSGVEAIKVADPGAVLQRVEALGQAVSAAHARVDATVQLGELARGELGTLRTAFDALPAQLNAAARAQAASMERIETSLVAKLTEADSRIQGVEKRLATAGTVGWITAGLALVAAALSGLALIQ